ncbi:TolC family protein [Chitinimonas sp.]|uniref:TolC family protein n=1 Tax=Chitinimonas sp. TaxID=1934313 RepID=UPI002F95F491
MKSKLFQPTLLALLVAAGLAGCATTPPPTFELPAHQTDKAPAELADWWKRFEDPTLNALVDEALAHNADIMTALQDVNQSQSVLSQARIALLPDVDLNLNGTRRNPSDVTSQPGQGGTTTVYKGGVAISYEVDLWGRVWKAKDAALANLLASQYARETTRAAVAAQTAKSYFSLLALDADEALLTQTLATRNEALALQQKRYKAGASGDYELKLAEVEQAAVAASLPRTVAAREQAEAALAVLLGRTPKEVVDGHVSRGAGLAELAKAQEIPPGLPADLLTRRPDVRRAEAQLAVAEASLSETKRRYFPTFSLTGFLGGESTSLGSLFNAPAKTWSLGAALAQPIVGLARIGAQVDSAKASRDQAEIAYAQAARAAYGDARSALAGHRAARDALIATQLRADSQSRVKELTEKRYQAGVNSYLDLLNAERDRLSAERDRVSALEQRLDSLVTVYQALGGGWSSDNLVKAD